jgi:CheY-like chemotaxis protein
MGLRPRVLIVDDEEDIRELLQGLLERSGFDAIAVESGEDALALLARMSPPCSIVLDLGMADVSGWEVINVIRSRYRAADFPVVVVSGHEPSTGPPGIPFIRKPIEISELVTALRAGSPP